MLFLISFQTESSDGEDAIQQHVRLQCITSPADGNSSYKPFNVPVNEHKTYNTSVTEHKTYNALNTEHKNTCNCNSCNAPNQDSVKNPSFRDGCSKQDCGSRNTPCTIREFDTPRSKQDPSKCSSTLSESNWPRQHTTRNDTPFSMHHTSQNATSTCQYSDASCSKHNTSKNVTSACRKIDASCSKEHGRENNCSASLKISSDSGTSLTNSNPSNQHYRITYGPTSSHSEDSLLSSKNIITSSPHHFMHHCNNNNIYNFNHAHGITSSISHNNISSAHHDLCPASFGGHAGSTNATNNKSSDLLHQVLIARTRRQRYQQQSQVGNLPNNV